MNEEQRSPDVRTPADEPAEDPSIAARYASAKDHPELTAAVTPGMALKRLRWCTPTGADGAEIRLLRISWEALGPEAAKLEAAEYERARQWLTQECGPWMTLDDDARESQTQTWRDRAAASADLNDQLWALAADVERRELTPPEVENARRLLEEALRRGSPDLLRDVGRVLSRGGQDASQLGPYAHPHAAYLFGLLACDLGGDCGARSEAVRIHCALVGLCGYPDYETLVLDARLNQAEAERVQAHRQILLERIRRGQIDGLFDPVRVPPRP